MLIAETQSGGRIVEGDVPLGKYRVEWNAAGELVSETIEIRDPSLPAKSRGVGDTIAKVTKAVGIRPCGGCKKRQQLLNEALPYNED